MLNKSFLAPCPMSQAILGVRNVCTFSMWPGPLENPPQACQCPSAHPKTPPPFPGGGLEGLGSARKPPLCLEKVRRPKAWVLPAFSDLLPTVRDL